MFKKIFDYEMRLAAMLNPKTFNEVKPAYNHKGLLQLRAINYALRAQNTPLKRFKDMVAYADMIKGLQSLPGSLVL